MLFLFLHYPYPEKEVIRDNVIKYVTLILFPAYLLLWEKERTQQNTVEPFCYICISQQFTGNEKYNF